MFVSIKTKMRQAIKLYGRKCGGKKRDMGQTEKQEMERWCTIRSGD